MSYRVSGTNPFYDSTAFSVVTYSGSQSLDELLAAPEDTPAHAAMAYIREHGLKEVPQIDLDADQFEGTTPSMGWWQTNDPFPSLTAQLVDRASRKCLLILLFHFLLLTSYPF